MPTSTRRLAAILFADITGYTALMQHDEQDALEKLARFKEVLEVKTAEFQGNIIQYYGDGCLVVFDSPLAAVSCAAAMQEAWRDAVPVRIGIHLGDVIFRENNVFGDAVNIASRIESLGVPGAVLLSQSVEVFALANAGFPVPKREEMEGKLKTPAAANVRPVENWKRWLLGVQDESRMGALRFKLNRVCSANALTSLPFRS